MAKVSTQPSAPDFGATNFTSGLALFSSQPPVSHIMAVVSSPERMPASSWSLPSQ
ncbi:hypothetical protein Y695_03317 [Hydrogenophaga sp. T4]|nr:hypothetical protein Y695_03317 [Hydrogenophaga sp. T4]